MAEERDQMFCEEGLNRLELEKGCLRTGEGKICKILKREDKVGKELFFSKCWYIGSFYKWPLRDAGLLTQSTAQVWKLMLSKREKVGSEVCRISDKTNQIAVKYLKYYFYFKIQRKYVGILLIKKMLCFVN